MFICTETLNLPNDVHAPETIDIVGTLSGDDDEIIVIKHLRRELFAEAHVCHLFEGPYGYGIYGMPYFRFIKIGNPDNIKKIDGINYTMACIAENIFNRDCKGFGLANWL